MAGNVVLAFAVVVWVVISYRPGRMQFMDVLTVALLVYGLVFFGLINLI